MSNIITLRPFTEADYEAVSEIGMRALPEHPKSPQEIRFQDEKRDPKHRWNRLIAEVDGKPVAWGECANSSWLYHPDKYFLMLMVLPEYRKRGIGGRLYDELAAGAANPIAYRSFGQENDPGTLSFLAKRGFVEEMRAWESRLDVAACDLTEFAETYRKVTEGGIIIKTYAELADDPNRDPNLYELYQTVLADVPSPEPHTRTEFDQWKKRFDRPGFLPNALFIAIDGEEMVGLSELGKNLTNGFMETGLTGVVREARGRGIASALKYQAVRYAKDNGASTIRTDNATTNAAMLGINVKLGFEKQPAWLFLARKFRDEE